MRGRAAASAGPLDGLWRYESIARDGTGPAAPLDGLFLFADGRFLQHSVNRGEPLADQLAQGHVGPFRLTSTSELVMTASVGFLVEPSASGTRLVDRRREHRAQARVDGERLTLTFDSGTVQVLSRLSTAPPRITWLDGGGFARVGSRFLLIHGDGDRALTATGEVTGDGDAVTLRAERWVTFVGGRAAYLRDAVVDLRRTRDRLEVPGYGTVKVVAAPQ